MLCVRRKHHIAFGSFISHLCYQENVDRNYIATDVVCIVWADRLSDLDSCLLRPASLIITLTMQQYPLDRAIFYNFGFFFLMDFPSKDFLIDFFVADDHFVDSEVLFDALPAFFAVD
jgi:hypothetical protein